MKSTIEKLENSKVKLTIEIENESFQQDINAGFREIAKQVTIPGIRKRKEPRGILDKKIGEEAGRQQAIQDATPKYYSQALNEHDLQPISQPELNVLSGEKEGNLEFEITVKVKPEVEIEGYDKLEVEVEVEPITDEQTQEQLDQFLSQYSTFKTIKSALKEGEVAILSINAFVDGEEVAGLQADDFQYEIGTQVISEKFDEELVGKKAGDKLEFTGPLSQRFNENAGLEVDFKVEVVEVKEKVLPELTDEWVKDKTAQASIKEFKAELRSQLDKVRVSQAKSMLQANVFKALADLVKEEAPKEMIAAEKENRINQMNQQFAQMGVSYEQFIEMADDEVKKQNEAELAEQSEIAAKADLALSYIVKKEALEPDESEIDEIIEHEAKHSKMKPAKLRKMITDNGIIKDVERDAARRKAVEFVVNNAKAFDKAGVEIKVEEEPAVEAKAESAKTVEAISESRSDSKTDKETT